MDGFFKGDGDERPLTWLLHILHIDAELFLEHIDAEFILDPAREQIWTRSGYRSCSLNCVCRM